MPRCKLYRCARLVKHGWKGVAKSHGPAKQVIATKFNAAQGVHGGKGSSAGYAAGTVIMWQAGREER
ncbi:hypothetical protein WJX81_001048 [Elliptochloris bilobata]|uniref:Uncharacterized protein n=1 Tax=Elliptochloris bilobata TaxID=381761 RepID=A0AAW1R0R9_9CHLO